MATHSIALAWSATFSFLFLFLTFSSFLPPWVLLPLPSPFPFLTLLAMPAPPCSTSHSLPGPVALLHLFGLLPPQPRWQPDKAGHWKMPAPSIPQQPLSAFQTEQTAAGSDLTVISAVAAAVGDPTYVGGPTYLLSLSKVTCATAPAVLSKMTLIYISTHLCKPCLVFFWTLDWF